MKRLTFCPISSSLSPKTWRRSECPRITQSTPQSFIMAGLERQDNNVQRRGLNYFNIHQSVQQFMSVSSQLIPDLPCKRSLGHLVAVLGRDADLGVQTGASEVQVDGWSAAHHLWNRKLFFKLILTLILHLSTSLWTFHCSHHHHHHRLKCPEEENTLYLKFAGKWSEEVLWSEMVNLIKFNWVTFIFSSCTNNLGVAVRPSSRWSTKTARLGSFVHLFILNTLHVVLYQSSAHRLHLNSSFSF